MKKTDQISIGCVILAAGNSERFGSNKLLARIGGTTMVQHAFDAIPTEKVCAVTVVTQYESIAKLAAKHGFSCVINRHPEQGLSHSVMLGTEALRDRCDGILYQVCDQPRLRRASVSHLLDRFCAAPDCIVSMSSAGRRGNPCVFPKAFFDELCSLSGDKGGRSVIERHRDRLILVETDEAELIDVDTQNDME